MSQKKEVKEQSIRMKRMMKNPTIQTKDCKIKETYEIYCTTFGQGQKQARNKIRSKFFPKYERWEEV